MPVIELLEMKAALPSGGRLLGLDIGSKTIGLAISDSALKVAAPLIVFERGKFAADMARLQALITERGVGGLVAGLPVGLDGREGPRSQSVRQFAANLLKVIDLPLAFWDERFSTIAAERPSSTSWPQPISSKAPSTGWPPSSDPHGSVVPKLISSSRRKPGSRATSALLQPWTPPWT